MKNPLKGIVVQRTGKAVFAVTALVIVYICIRAFGWIQQKSGTPGPAVSDSLLSENGRTGLRVAIPPNAVFAPGVVENDGLSAGAGSRYVSNYGLKVEFQIIEDPDRSIGRLVSNKCDIVWATVDSLALHYPRLSASNPVAFFTPGFSRGADAVAADASISSPAGFRGKTIACAENSTGHFFMLYLLSVSGVKPSEVSWKFTLTPEDAAWSFERKKADVCAGEMPRLGRAVERRPGSGILVTTGDAGRLIPNIFITREPFMMLHGDLLEKFTAGWIEGAGILLKEGGAALEVPGRAFRTSAAELKQELGRVRLSDYRDNLSFFNITDDSWGGFAFIFDTASGLWMEQDKLSSEVPAGMLQTSGILLRLRDRAGLAGNGTKTVKEFAFQRIAGYMPQKMRMVTGIFPIYFGKNAVVPDFDSRIQLKKFADAATVFAGSYILLRAPEDPDEDKWMNLAQRRGQEITGTLTGEYKIPSERFIYAAGDTAIPVRKPTGNRRVDLILVSPPSE